MHYRLGIDVGGTHTDAVVLDERRQVVAKAKVATTEDVSSGIYEALDKVLKGDSIDPAKIRYAMLGTTHCTNAIVERKRLIPVGIIRVGKPATLAIPPLTGWPEDLRQLLGNHRYIVTGGHEYDGREIASLDEQEVREACRNMKEKVEGIAVTAVFSPVSGAHEARVGEIVREELGEQFPVSYSREIGSIGLLERENATILNAALTKVAASVAEGFAQALQKRGIGATIFFGQNDGTLMSVDYALRYPIFTVACGPTNSIRGAAHLSGCSNGLVVDVGGTTTDIGVLVKGFPRESSIPVDIGGVRTNFRMPDLLSIGLGGGTIVRNNAQGKVELGPDSVGYALRQQARLYGGQVLTATDIAVFAGKMDWPGAKIPEDVDQGWIDQAYAQMKGTVEERIDQMKTSAAPIPVILVGGGSLLFPNQLEGAEKVIRPQHHEVANAIGAAIGQVSGQVERIYSLDQIRREEALAEAKEMAIAEAIHAGADPTSVEIVDVEDIPLAYLPGNATRIRVKAAGYLKEMAAPAEG